MTRTPAPSRRGGREPRSDAVRNKEALLRAATSVFHREGLGVPMSTIAAEAGVGVGTLYRHFPDRDALLTELTHRSFERVLHNAVTAEQDGASPVESLQLFIRAAITARDELVLPLHGGPAVTSSATQRVRAEAHRTIQRVLDRGVAEGSVRSDVRAMDVVVFGAMLSQPKPRSTDWNAICSRLLDTFLRGLAP